MSKFDNISAEEKKMLKKMFISSFVMEHSYNYERQQGLGFSLGMWPVIKKVYKTKEEQGDALERHMAVFNATPHIETLIMGIAAAMEKEASLNPDFDKSSINSVKIGLMGPLSGIGDSIFWGSLRVVAAGVGLALATQGSPLGALVFLLVYNIPHFIIKYYCTFIGYSFGVDLMKNVSGSGILDKITKAASIIGLMVIGAMTASMVSLTLSGSFTISGNEFIIQDYIDQIFPMLLPLLYTLFIFYLLQVRKWKATTLLLFSIVISFVLVYTGLI
ncbi:PTS system mannose/fructose/sorbose family transporter subunit IID [[Clostridium] innocuum]|uniref:PTS system mannose/fructose/sorbose family transporter subunit IID n=1 Tax=Holdemanella porci TaxID=2652276 RepID=UPI0021490778|nr:PTS system mannose/fructose/sorbose family transporter subunit IID [[Clostridium] innocuum]MCR0275998.1 PTS system mannose/fructose/sorbose family transporter subunit IID [[Clostridium] innocuum]